MNPATLPAEDVSAAHAPRSAFARVLLHGLLLAAAAGAFVAWQHFKLQGQSTPALASLIAAGLLAFSPLRALIGEFFSIEGKLLHALHGLGGLAVMGLIGGGVVEGNSLMSHAAMAPFALMGAAQAIMHQNHPRNAQQAAALQRFASSLPEVAEFTRGDLTSPANAARAVAVMQDLISKAEVLGETELKADPNFQSALARTTTRAGLTLGLDSIDQGINKLAANPAAAPAVTDLRQRLAKARSIAAAGAR